MYYTLGIFDLYNYSTLFLAIFGWKSLINLLSGLPKLIPKNLYTYNNTIYGGLFDLIFSHYIHARIADSDAASSPWVLFLSALVEVVVESSASMNERSYAYVIRNSNNFGLLQCYKICKKEQYLRQLHSHTTALCSQFASKATFF